MEVPPESGARELDVRPLLARGEEPFGTIMEAVDALEPGQALVLRSPFDPVPLHKVLGKRGYARTTRELAPDDFETVYRPEGAAGDADGEVAATAAPPAPPAAEVAGDEADIVLDVRGLTPPEPMERTLAALTDLPPGGRLLQINERVPVFLLPLLDERGYGYSVAEDARGTLITIWALEDAR